MRVRRPVRAQLPAAGSVRCCPRRVRARGQGRALRSRRPRGPGSAGRARKRRERRTHPRLHPAAHLQPLCLRLCQRPGWQRPDPGARAGGGRDRARPTDGRTHGRVAARVRAPRPRQGRSRGLEGHEQAHPAPAPAPHLLRSRHAARGRAHGGEQPRVCRTRAPLHLAPGRADAAGRDALHRPARQAGGGHRGLLGTGRGPHALALPALLRRRPRLVPAAHGEHQERQAGQARHQPGPQQGKRQGHHRRDQRPAGLASLRSHLDGRAVLALPGRRARGHDRRRAPGRDLRHHAHGKRGHQLQPGRARRSRARRGGPLEPAAHGQGSRDARSPYGSARRRPRQPHLRARPGARARVRARRPATALARSHHQPQRRRAGGRARALRRGRRVCKDRKAAHTPARPAGPARARLVARAHAARRVRTRCRVRVSRVAARDAPDPLRGPGARACRQRADHRLGRDVREAPAGGHDRGRPHGLVRRPAAVPGGPRHRAQPIHPGAPGRLGQPQGRVRTVSQARRPARRARCQPGPGPRHSPGQGRDHCPRSPGCRTCAT